MVWQLSCSALFYEFRTKRVNALQTIAAEYAGQGLAVIAALPRSKAPAVAWADFQWESPTPKEVEAMFSSEEEFNVGIICGAASQNLAVFDAETKASFIELVDRFGAAGFGDTWFVETARGGHVYFRLPEPVKPMKQGPVELRGQGQYVLAPPSLHPSGARYEFLNRSPSICQVASLEEIYWLKLQPASRKDQRKLPRKATYLLNGNGQYQSRSEAEQALVTVLVNAGYLFAEILALFQRYKVAGKFREIEQQDPIRALNWLKRSYQSAREWCAQESHARRLARVAMKYAATRPWPGRTGSADRRVYEAHAAIAFRAGKETYHASSRDLAETAGCERKTASRATRRLCKCGLILLVQGSTFSFANRFRLAEFDHGHVNFPLIQKSPSMGVGQSSPLELPDAFRQRGLGRSAYEVFLALQPESLPVKSITQKTGRHAQTVRGALWRLKDRGLVQKDRRLWGVTKPLEQLDMTALAAQVGTAGALRKQKAKHRAERLRRSMGAKFDPESARSVKTARD